LPLDGSTRDTQNGGNGAGCITAAAVVVVVVVAAHAGVAAPMGCGGSHWLSPVFVFTK